MYISKLSIKNFRGFREISLNFKKGVNILIGENNSGKTAIIDVLRICLGYGKADNNINIQETDLHINPENPLEKNKEIQFDLIFDMGDNPKEKECFYDFISQDPQIANRQTIQFHLKFTLEETGKKKFFKRTIWGGDNLGQTISYEALQEIFFTYLSPLRDAVSGLKPYSYDNKTAQLFNQLTKYKKEENEKEIKLDDKKKKELANKLYTVFESNENDWKYILKAGKDKVNDHLTGTGINNKYPNIEMNYVGRKYSDVVRGIELKRPVFDPEKLEGEEQKYFELFQNGLGENNLVFASVILGDLINRCEDEELEIYNALLVEEPEAHLHPQYQNTFFEYLNTLQQKGLQIFITSHSPTITAKSDTDNITILQKQKYKIAPFSFLHLTKVDFSSENKKHLRKFLDTTKSQMFFANGTLLVEGIAEAILIPMLSKKFLEPHKFDLEKEGVEIVNIGGVAFEHFAKLYNNDDEKKRLSSRCSLITDSDPKQEKLISDRAIKAKELHKNNLFVSLAPNTLEYDLFNTSVKNKLLMQEVYRTMHPSTDDIKGDFTAEVLMQKFSTNKDKADFALELYDRLLNESSFGVPKYIQDAIEFVVNKKKEDV
jgi:putative ATP-dependent endonuclease of the OLD family